MGVGESKLLFLKILKQNLFENEMASFQFPAS